jgi:hypothetical protein
MKMSSLLSAGVAACISLALAGGTLGAQDTLSLDPSVAATHWQGDARAFHDAGFSRQPNLDAALRDQGFRADRLSRAETRALEDAFRQLFPNQHPQRYRLNRTQADALVYIALLQPDERGRGRGGVPGRASCDTAGLIVYELGDMLGDQYRDHPRGRPGTPLTRDEQDELRSGARQIHQLALRCGNRALAEEADALAALAGQRRTDRAQVERQIRRMKTLVRSDRLARW